MSVLVKLTPDARLDDVPADELFRKVLKTLLLRVAVAKPKVSAVNAPAVTLELPPAVELLRIKTSKIPELDTLAQKKEKARK